MVSVLQYFVFDKTGNDILEASIIPCESENEMLELAKTIEHNYKNDEQFKDINLLLSCKDKVLFNSKEAR